jgi:large subunit ribosomal protein L15
MKLDEIMSASGRKRRRKRVGRGDGSGKGKTSGRGHKGYGSRSGARQRMGYEGGQTPALARLPKIGFNNVRFRKEYQCVNVDILEKAFDDGAGVDAAALKKARLIRHEDRPVRILGRGELKKKLTVSANSFSATAREKITQAGGEAKEIE